MASWTSLPSLALALLLPAVPAFALSPGARGGRPSCAVAWDLFPMNGTPSAERAVVVAVPRGEVTLRLLGGTGGFAAARLGLGEEHVEGPGGFSRRLGPWSAMERPYLPVGEAGIAVGPDQSVEFLLEGLASNTHYAWELQCQQGDRWTPVRGGRGAFHTLPAPGEPVDVVVVTDSDPHVMNAWFKWAGQARATIADKDFDHVPDYEESYRRNMNAIALMADRAARLDAHFVDDLGDTLSCHCPQCNACSASDPVGPCNGPSVEEPLTGARRELGWGPTGALYAGQPGYFDDEVDRCEARIAFALNSYNPVWRASSGFVKFGNHAGHAIYGNDGEYSGHVNLPVGPTSGGQMAVSTRQAIRNYIHNPNDVGFYPACDGGPQAPGGCLEQPDWQDQGFYWSFEAGEVLFIYLDEYVRTRGRDEHGRIFQPGTTFDDADCWRAKQPVPTCESSSVDHSSDLPTTPYEWTLGDAQLAWLDALLSTTQRKIVTIAMHHVPGGIVGTSEYSYGRGSCEATERYCSAPATASSPLVVKHGTLSPNDPILCFSKRNAAGNKWCDWADDGIENGSSTCNAAIDPEAPFMGEMQQVFELARDRYLDRTGGIVQFRFGHDHLMSFCAKQVPGGTTSFLMWNLGQSGNSPLTSWAGSTWFEAFHDFNENGVPDYRNAPYLHDETEILDSDLAGSVEGWDGKGFGTTRYRADGCIEMSYVAAPAHDDPKLNGQVVWGRVYCGSGSAP